MEDWTKYILERFSSMIEHNIVQWTDVFQSSMIEHNIVQWTDVFQSSMTEPNRVQWTDVFRSTRPEAPCAIGGTLTSSH